MSIRTVALLAGMGTGMIAGDATAYYDPHTGKYVNPYENGYRPQTVGNLYPSEGTYAPAYGLAVGPMSPGPALGFRGAGGSYYGQAGAGFPLFLFPLNRSTTTQMGRMGR